MFACLVTDVHVFVHIRVLAEWWGQGNMRDILFRHIPSGADLMTRDLKMYMLGKEGGWEGGQLRRDRRGGAGGGRQWVEEAGTKWMKTAANKAECKMQM